MPKSFGYPFKGDIPYLTPGFQQTDVWAPLALSALAKADRVNFQGGNAAIARLSPGVSIEQAQGELGAIQKRLDLL